MIDVPPTANSPQIAPVVYYVDLIAPGSTNATPAFTVKHAPSSLPTSYLAVTAFEIDSSTAQASQPSQSSSPTGADGYAHVNQVDVLSPIFAEADMA